jgi:hypothetical protein
MYLDTYTEIAKDISLDVCLLCLCKSEETQGDICLSSIIALCLSFQLHAQ